MSIKTNEETLSRVGMLLTMSLKRFKEEGGSGSTTVTVHVARGDPAKLETSEVHYEQLERRDSH